MLWTSLSKIFLGASEALSKIMQNKLYAVGLFLCSWKYGGRTTILYLQTIQDAVWFWMRSLAFPVKNSYM